MRCPAGEVSIYLNGILAGIFSILWAYYMAGKKKKKGALYYSYVTSHSQSCSLLYQKFPFSQ